jgi:methylase of polypeptide subunit release factors
MDVAGLAALRTPDGERVLAEVAERGGADERTLLATLTALRERYDAGLVSAALTQVRLRDRARAKFGADADRMFFTPDGVEQATRADVATRHAGRFAAAGAERLLDLCCGIGGDLVAAARAGLTVTGVDRDPVTAEVARANAEVLGLADRVLVIGDGRVLAEEPAGALDEHRVLDLVMEGTGHRGAPLPDGTQHEGDVA